MTVLGNPAFKPRDARPRSCLPLASGGHHHLPRINQSDGSSIDNVYPEEEQDPEHAVSGEIRSRTGQPSTVHERVHQWQQGNSQSGDQGVNNPDPAPADDARSGKRVEDHRIKQPEYASHHQVDAEAGNPGCSSNRKADQGSPHHGEVQYLESHGDRSGQYGRHEGGADHAGEESFQPAHRKLLMYVVFVCTDGALPECHRAGAGAYARGSGIGRETELQQRHR